MSEWTSGSAFQFPSNVFSYFILFLICLQSSRRVDRCDEERLFSPLRSMSSISPSGAKELRTESEDLDVSGGNLVIDLDFLSGEESTASGTGGEVKADGNESSSPTPTETVDSATTSASHSFMRSPPKLVNSARKSGGSSDKLKLKIKRRKVEAECNKSDASLLVPIPEENKGSSSVAGEVSRDQSKKVMVSSHLPKSMLA